MNVVITGAGKGIGFALVNKFLAAGGHAVWACSRDITAFTETRQPGLTVVSMDIATAEADAMAAAVQEAMPSVDVLIHNAGLLINSPFESLAPDAWQRMFDVNFFSVVRINQALLPLLRKSAGAHIVHIGSMGGVQGTSKFPGLAAYSASKAALANLTECLAEELKPEGIHVNCLALGAVNTEMLRAAFPDFQASMSSEEMAAFIYDFSVNRRAFFNGKILPVSSTTP